MISHAKSHEIDGDDRGATEGPLVSSGKKAPGAFLTISEVADVLDVPQHVLRFWETKFSQVKPLKRGGGRRYYRPEDVDLLKVVHKLLYTDKYTIKGVQNLLKGQSKLQILQGAVSNDPAPQQQAASNSNQETAEDKAHGRLLHEVLNDLKSLRAMIKTD
ncbi:MAG: MerR family transcriptional regulator [Rhodospirillales bacterium]|nr:MerR family transcriptional regulator [Rhodospirillales bacterium]MCB9980392.1 MerR family transcriptional regulator [Rhodospirillales bacterium]